MNYFSPETDLFLHQLSKKNLMIVLTVKFFHKHRKQNNLISRFPRFLTLDRTKPKILRDDYQKNETKLLLK